VAAGSLFSQCRRIPLLQSVLGSLGVMSGMINYIAYCGQQDCCSAGALT